MKSQPRSAILRHFQNQEYRFTIINIRESLYEERKRKTNANKRNHRKFLKGDGSVEQLVFFK